MKNKTLALYIALIAWAVAFFGLGMACAKADLVMDSYSNPAYAAMPQNMYHNTIYGHKSSNNNFDKCKTPGSVYKIVIEKSKKLMTLYDVNDCVVKQYTVRTGLNKGPKQCEGDKKTPEGTYKIKDKRDSKYVRFLEIDYPRAKDIKRAKELGCNPGNAVGIHYYNKEYTNDPSTLEGSLGCITVWNKSEIKEIDKMVKVGTLVEIRR